jgi:hypothetical protein
MSTLYSQAYPVVMGRPSRFGRELLLFFEDPPKQWTHKRNNLSTLVLEETNEKEKSTVSG